MDSLNTVPEIMAYCSVIAQDSNKFRNSLIGKEIKEIFVSGDLELSDPSGVLYSPDKGKTHLVFQDMNYSAEYGVNGLTDVYILYFEGMVETIALRHRPPTEDTFIGIYLGKRKPLKPLKVRDLL